jgi:uncharacterized protein (TIGR00369 family)
MRIETAPELGVPLIDAIEPVQTAKLTSHELESLLAAAFPQIGGLGFRIEELQHRFARIRQVFNDGQLRPGGTISGGTMMILADYAMYVAVLASIGWVPLAVTSNLSIDFLNKPPARDLLADCRLIKLSKRRAVGVVVITSEGLEEPVAHVTSTYAIPPTVESA